MTLLLKKVEDEEKYAETICCPIHNHMDNVLDMQSKSNEDDTNMEGAKECQSNQDRRTE